MSVDIESIINDELERLRSHENRNQTAEAAENAAEA